MNAYEKMKKISNKGEQFVFDNLAVLFPHLWIAKSELNTAIPGKNKTEGADIETWSLNAYRTDEWLDESWRKVFEREEFSEARRTVTGELLIFDSMLLGPIEVKTITFNQYLTRNDYKTDCGEISFAIWNSFENEKQRSRLGSLYRMFYPKEAEHERQPVAYAVVMLNQKEEPYACLAFEDFHALKEKLISIGNKYGLDLTEKGFEQIPCWYQLNGWKSPYDWSKMMMEQNKGLWLKAEMWYMRMSEVIELATVTLVGDPPEIIDQENDCPGDLQEKRWNYLKKHKYQTISPSMVEKLKDKKQRRRAIYDLLTSFPWDKDPATPGDKEIDMGKHLQEHRKKMKKLQNKAGKT